MKIEWFRSATVGLTSPSGVSVLCDPWITDGAFIGSWFHWPPLEGFEFDELVARRWDFLYISHLHADHFDRRLVSAIARRQPNCRAIIANFQHPWLKRAVEKCGFAGNRLLVANDGDKLEFRDLSMSIWTADACDPLVCGVSIPCPQVPGFNRSIDSIALFESHGLRVLHANDALAVASVASSLNAVKSVDFLLGHYGGAGPFPQAFPDVVDKQRISRQRAQIYLHRLAAAADQLSARYVMPFAGQYQLAGRLTELNQDRSVVRLDEAVRWLNSNCNATAIALRPFGQIDLRRGDAEGHWVEPAEEQLAGYLASISSVQFPYERDNETWPTAIQELQRSFERVSERYSVARSYRKEGRDEQPDTATIQVIADPRLAVVNSGQCSLESISLTMEFGGDKLGGGVNVQPTSDNLTQIAMDPRLLRRLVQRSPRYHGFTQMHWNQAEIGSHMQWRRWGAYDAEAHGFLDFMS
jgi:UDP-MurNAc hydroxylase